MNVYILRLGEYELDVLRFIVADSEEEAKAALAKILLEERGFPKEYTTVIKEHSVVLVHTSHLRSEDIITEEEYSVYDAGLFEKGKVY